MASGDRGHDLAAKRQVNKVEFLTPDPSGVETLKHDGLEVSVDKEARGKFAIYTARDEIILVRAGVEAQQIEDALNQAMGTDGHINLSDFLSHTPEVPLPVDIPLQRTIDVIFVEDRRGMSNETSRVTHIWRGDPRLNRIQTEVNGTNSQYVIAERASESRTEKSTQWQERQMTQGKSRTTIFVDGEPSINARLTGGNRLSLEGDRRTFPVSGTNRNFPSDFQKPLMHVITETDISNKPIPTAEIAARVNLVAFGKARGVIVIR